jgi:hypothetical protein
VTLRPQEVGKGAAADGITEGDGSFMPSTYAAYDGLEVGVAPRVAVTLRRPSILPDGRAGPTLLAGKICRYSNQRPCYSKVKPNATELKIDLE